MNIPDKIKCGALTYEVRQLEMAKFGDVDFVAQEIRLMKSQKHDNKGETLLHEIIHIAIVQSGLSERLDKDPIKLTTEELVRAITPQLHMMLSENNLNFSGN